MVEGINDLVEGAKAGNPKALTELAHAQALGFCTPRNIDLALDNLARAAAVGWPNAVRELQFLAHSSVASAKKLRASVDLEAWRRAPPRRVLLEAPRLRAFENFATSAECDWLVALGRDKLRRATVYKTSGSEMQADDTRTNTEADFQFDASDIVFSLMQDRIARATAVPVEYHEVAKLLHYDPGETFARHCDFFLPWMKEELELGQRVGTFLLYLNDDYDGGETEFTEVGFKFKGRKGDALFFVNVDLEGDGDQKSYHAGQPTARGEKWLLSQWLREKPINAYQTPRVSSSPLTREWCHNA